jgi:hypothetical protein
MGPRPGSGGNMGRTGGVSPLSSLSLWRERARTLALRRSYAQRSGAGGAGYGRGPPSRGQGGWQISGFNVHFAQRSHAANKGSGSRLHATASHRKFATVQIAWKVCCQLRGRGRGGSRRGGQCSGTSTGAEKGAGRQRRRGRTEGGTTSQSMGRENGLFGKCFHRADWKNFSRGEEASMGDIAIRANMAYLRRRGPG